MRLPHPLPCVFSRTGFVRRHFLSFLSKELWSIRDFPLEVLKSPDHNRLTRWVDLDQVPFKICHGLVRRLKGWSSNGYFSSYLPVRMTEAQENMNAQRDASAECSQTRIHHREGYQSRWRRDPNGAVEHASLEGYTVQARTNQICICTSGSSCLDTLLLVGKVACEF
ncbi:hypothetical protein ACA910_007480 [Epithemia clementina (nom. ined.)]